MGDYLKLTNGVPTDALALAASAGAGSAGSLVKLDGTGKIDATMMPAGVAGESRNIVASEALAAGNFVNVWNNGGTPNIRKADASNGREAHGFVLAAVANGAAGVVYPEEAVNTALAGMTPGARQFLDTAAAGGRKETTVFATGQIAQPLGVALSATEMLFRPDTPILVA